MGDQYISVNSAVTSEPIQNQRVRFLTAFRKALDEQRLGWAMWDGAPTFSVLGQKVEMGRCLACAKHSLESKGACFASQALFRTEIPVSAGEFSASGDGSILTPSSDRPSTTPMTERKKNTVRPFQFLGCDVSLPAS